jgi:hypothetical protein
MAIGTAAVAGFAAIVVAVPSKQERELRRLERIREAMNPVPPNPVETNGSTAKPAEKHSWGAVLLREMIQLIRPVLMTAITAGIKASAHQPTHPAAPPYQPEGPDKSN